MCCRKLVPALFCFFRIPLALHAAPPPRFEGLCDYRRPVSTRNADAQA